MDPLYIQLAVKLTAGFLALFIVTKIIGRREMRQLTPFDFISAIVLSELVGNTLYNKETNAFHMLFSIVIWAVYIICVDKWTLKSYKARKVLDGLPVDIIKQGKLDKEALRKNNMDLNELLSMLRQRDVFSLKEVEYALLEPNGSVSVLKKAKYSNVTLKDADIAPSNAPPPIVFILDGLIMKDSLKEYKKDENWLRKELHKQGYDNPEDVPYAEWSDHDSVFVLPQSKNNSKQ